MARKRYAQVGIGGRSEMFTQAITETYRDHCELVGLCDTNQGRMDLRNERLPGGPVPTYPAADFDRMIRETKPDTVVVTTVDQFHDHYICRAMDLGCDAITEKPMTTTAEKCQRIADTVKRTGRDLRVTFNYRYAPVRSQVKRLLLEGVIGRVLSVDFSWLLDIRHGADYYRRWHRHKINSGGLLVHKATHHFDLVNWWIGSTPVEVYAQGKREFYTPEQAARYGLEGRGERCHGCPVADRCRFFWNLTAREGHRRMYFEQEHHDGYVRDQCVFSDRIDIEDTMNLTVRYQSGVMMAYSLNSFSPWEGYRINFNGTDGRLEHQVGESSYVSGDGTVPGETITEKAYIHVYPHFGHGYDVPIERAKGGHGGGDRPLLDDVFNPQAPPDPLRRAAGLADGAWSILTGVAANQSIATGRPVRADRLVTGLPRPAYLEAGREPE